MNPALVAIAIQEAPAVLALLRNLFVKKHPDAAVPSDEAIINAYHDAFNASLAKDAAWLSAHPE